MKTPSHPFKSIREGLSNRGDCSNRFLHGVSERGVSEHGVSESVSVGDLLRGTSLGGRLPELSGRSILLATRDQLAAALALIELDGVARRIVICPPDIPSQHFPSLIAKAAVDAIVSDYELSDRDWPADLLLVRTSSGLSPVEAAPCESCATEWVLLTSGTTGSPKMIVHNLASLMAPIDMSLDQMNNSSVVWGTFYDIRRYGGLQIFLRAILGRGSLVLSSPGEPVADHLARLGQNRVTHISGTPSQWRRTLMSAAAAGIAPKYIRLSGEIVDQAILKALQSFYPGSSISHAFASTEAGVAFEVDDGLAGFPTSVLGKRGEVEIKVCDGTLHIRSNRAASRYIDVESGDLAGQEGFVDTDDVVEMRGDRYCFLGRRNGVINVGGLKVYPEEVEAVINSHPAVRMSQVRPRRNSLTGALVSADVVLKQAHEAKAPDHFTGEILEICRQRLAPHKIPAAIRWVPALAIADAGKLDRGHA
jgi:acyl-coenzyme A synthetase/AMP-(fatty) acid ligase